MAATTIVPIQKRFLEPYTQRTFQYGTPDSHLFLSRYTNNILRVFGDDCILKELDIYNLQKINNDTGVSFQIESGDLIQDLTYIKFDEITNITLPNVSAYDDSNKIIVYTKYSYLHSIEANPIRILVSFYNPMTQEVIDGWDSNKNRIILGLISFTKDVNDKILSLELDTTLDKIVINGLEVSIRQKPKNSIKTLVVDGGILP